MNIKAIKAIAINMQLLGLVLFLTGCVDIRARYVETTPAISPRVEVTGVPTETPIQTRIPTPTVPPTSGPTKTPESTPESFSYSSSIDPSRLVEIVNTKPPFVGGYVKDYTEFVKYPSIGFRGYPVAYSLEKSDGEKHLFVLFAAAGGLIKADVDVFNLPESVWVWPQGSREINYIDKYGAKEISDTLNSYIRIFNESGEFEESTGYLLLEAINNGQETQACLISYEGLENAGRLCAYNPSNEQFTPQQMLDKIKSFITPLDEQNPAGSLDFEKYPTLSSEGNMYVTSGL